MRLVFQPEVRSIWAKTAIRIGAVALALVLATLFLSLTGKDPIQVFGAIYDGALGSRFGLFETLLRAVPLLLCGLGIAIASRMQLWNVGAEGQFYMGAFGATFVALKFGTLPAALLLPLMMLAAMVCGGLWALLAGAARAYWSTSETITTLLLNYIAINVVTYFVYGPWKDPNGSNFPFTPTFEQSAWLPLLVERSRLHVGLLIALAVAAIVWLVLRYSKWGYEIRVVGDSPSAARYAGISIARNILLVMFTAGALAGLAGMMEVSGVIHKLQKDISPGYGYSAIIIAYLSQLNPLALVLVSFLFGGLQAGGFSVQRLGVPLATAYMIQGVILFCVLGAELFTRGRLKLVTTKARKEAA